MNKKIDVKNLTIKKDVITKDEVIANHRTSLNSRLIQQYFA